MREHEWITPVMFKLTPGQAAAAMGGARLSLDIGMVHPDFYGRGGAVNSPIGCLHCEQPYSECHGKPCPGQPPGRLEYVTDSEVPT